MTPAPKTALLQALARLLDDTSPVVRRSVLAQFESLGETGAEFLRQIALSPNRVAATHAQWYLGELRCSDPVGEFRNFIRSLNYELETGSMLLSRTVFPDLDVTRYCLELDRIASRCRELLVEPQSVRDRCKVINRVLFHEIGFRGNTANYVDPENSFVHRTLDRRTGLPITLSIIYLLVAERLGISLEPVGLPGHFVVGCFVEGDIFFVDAFDHGRFLSVDDLFAHLAARQIEPDVTHLAPTTVRETLCRCCRNLANHYAVANNDTMARLFAGFVDEFEVTYQQNSSP